MNPATTKRLANSTRRDLIRRGVLAGIGTLLPTSGLEASRRHATWPLGVQLWSVEVQMARDADTTLRRLGVLGYRSVESAGLHGRTPAAFRRAIRAVGMRWNSAHVSMTDLVADAAGQIGRARDGGVQWLIVSSPMPLRPLPRGVEWNLAMVQAMTLEAWKRNAALLDDMSLRAKAAGLQFGYHNHPAEFANYEGRRGIDVLMTQTDRHLVRFQLDVAWAVAGGQDPVALLRTHPGRFASLHLKDITVPPPAGRLAHSFATTEMGRGTIDWRAVFRAARSAGVSSAYVEQEGPYVRPVLESLAISRDYLSALADG